MTKVNLLLGMKSLTPMTFPTGEVQPRRKENKPSSITRKFDTLGRGAAKKTKKTYWSGKPKYQNWNIISLRWSVTPTCLHCDCCRVPNEVWVNGIESEGIICLRTQLCHHGCAHICLQVQLLQKTEQKWRWEQLKMCLFEREKEKTVRESDQKRDAACEEERNTVWWKEINCKHTEYWSGAEVFKPQKSFSLLTLQEKNWEFKTKFNLNILFLESVPAVAENKNSCSTSVQTKMIAYFQHHISCWFNQYAVRKLRELTGTIWGCSRDESLLFTSAQCCWSAVMSSGLRGQ